MTLTGGIIVFVLIWWMVFFMTLPWGVRRAGAEAEGHDAGAPERPRLWIKAAVTTAISAALFAIVWWAVARSGFAFR